MTEGWGGDFWEPRDDDSNDIPLPPEPKIRKQFMSTGNDPDQDFVAGAIELVTEIAAMGWMNGKPNTLFEDFQDRAIALVTSRPGPHIIVGKEVA